MKDDIKWDEIKTFEDYKQAKSKINSAGSELHNLTQELKKAKPEDKKNIGIKIGKLKSYYDNKFTEVEKRLKREKIQSKIDSEFIDISKPVSSFGSLHPITIVENKLRDWLNQNGYFEAYGGEIVTDEYNFDKLNIPKDHPARAMHDSLYINKNLLLRTHNTGVTMSELAKHSFTDVNTYAIGKVYRNDEDDVTHTHQFTQLDFICVGENIGFSNLIWTIKSMMSYLFEEELEIRLRPSYFPFTEPSAEIDILYRGEWVEVLGAGMIHPNVLNMAGYDDKRYSGFAAGLGLERLVMIKYNIKDIRELYKNDLRGLAQFSYEK